MRKSSKEATAFHEAGHVVAARWMGLRVRQASIIGKDSAAGFVESDSPLKGIRLDFDGSDRARLKAESAIIVLHAGPEAQRRYSPRSIRSWHASRDYEEISNLALRVNGSSEMATAHIRWLQLRAKGLVEGKWREIQAVAMALINAGSLDFNGINEVVMKAFSQRDRLIVTTDDPEG